MSDEVSMSSAVSYVRDMFGLEEVPELPGTSFEEIITKRAIPLYSRYYPLYVPYILRISDPGVKISPNVFRVTAPEGLTLRNIDKLAKNETRFFNSIGGAEFSGDAPSHFPLTGFAWNVMMNQAKADVWSAMSLPDRVSFVPPSSVRIISGIGGGYGSRHSGIYGLRLHCNHPASLTTIHPNTFETIFLELCWVVCRRYLYPIRKRFENMNTPFGEIIMGSIDRLENAEAELKELKEEMRKDSRRSSNRRKVFTS